MVLRRTLSDLYGTEGAIGFSTFAARLCLNLGICLAMLLVGSDLYLHSHGLFYFLGAFLMLASVPVAIWGSVVLIARFIEYAGGKFSIATRAMPIAVDANSVHAADLLQLNGILIIKSVWHKKYIYFSISLFLAWYFQKQLNIRGSEASSFFNFMGFLFSMTVISNFIIYIMGNSTLKLEPQGFSIIRFNHGKFYFWHDIEKLFKVTKPLGIYGKKIVFSTKEKLSFSKKLIRLFSGQSPFISDLYEMKLTDLATLMNTYYKNAQNNAANSPRN